MASSTSSQAAAPCVTRPALSLIVATPDQESLDDMLERLAAQSDAHDLELVLLNGGTALKPIAPDLEACFASIRSLEGVAGQSFVQAVRSATAPVIGFLEPGICLSGNWISAMVKAHCGSWVGVGPLVLNANPGSAASWADLFLRHSRWMDPSCCGECAALPVRLSTFKRDALLALGDDLDAALSCDELLLRRLVANGGRFCQSVAAQTRVTHSVSLGALARAAFTRTRTQTQAMLKTQTLLDRLRTALKAMAHPLIALWRINAALHSPEIRRQEFLRALPSLCAGLLSESAGSLAAQLSIRSEVGSLLTGRGSPAALAPVLTSTDEASDELHDQPVAA